MNVIAINGSPKADGNTSEILKIMCSELERQGIGTKILHIGKEPIRGCLACGYCARPDKDGCMIKKDIVNEAALEMCKADGIILAAPAYYAGIPGTMKAFLDRVFQSRKKQFAYKIGAAAAVSRRTGSIAVFDQLRHYFDLAQMLTPPTQYWSVIYGRQPGEVLQDAEGVQTLRREAAAMAWLMKIVENGKETFPPPPEKERIMTNFIR